MAAMSAIANKQNQRPGNGQRQSAKSPACLQVGLRARHIERRQTVSEHHADDNGNARRRQQVVVLPVQAGKDNLKEGRDRPGRDQAATRGGVSVRRARYSQRGNRRQPEGPASRPPPDEVIRGAERPGELARGIGVAGQPADQDRAEHQARARCRSRAPCRTA